MNLIVLEKSYISIELFSLNNPKAISVVGTVDKTLVNAIEQMRADELML
jgi:hypothetical protein